MKMEKILEIQKKELRKKINKLEIENAQLTARCEMLEGLLFEVAADKWEGVPEFRRGGVRL